MIESLSLINSVWPCCSHLCILSSSNWELPCSALTPALCCDVDVSLPLLALICVFECKLGEIQDVLFKTRWLWVQRYCCKNLPGWVHIGPMCTRALHILLMWDLDFGRRIIYLCWSFTSCYVLLLTGGVCDLSFFKATCWLVILGVENNLKKIWNILKKSLKH